MGSFFTDLTHRREAVKRRCRTVLQAKADELIGDTQANPLPPAGVVVMLSCWALGKLARLRCSAPPVEEVVDQRCALSATAAARMALVRFSVAYAFWCAACTMAMQFAAFEIEIFAGAMAAVTSSNDSSGGRECGWVVLSVLPCDMSPLAITAEHVGQAGRYGGELDDGESVMLASCHEYAAVS